MHHNLGGMSSGMLISKIALKGHRIYEAFAQTFSEPKNSEGEGRGGNTQYAWCSAWVNKFIKSMRDIFPCWDPHGQMQEILVTWIFRENNINLTTVVVIVQRSASFSLFPFYLSLRLSLVREAVRVGENIAYYIILDKDEVGGHREKGIWLSHWPGSLEIPLHVHFKWSENRNFVFYSNSDLCGFSLDMIFLLRS